MAREASDRIDFLIERSAAGEGLVPPKLIPAYPRTRIPQATVTKALVREPTRCVVSPPVGTASLASLCNFPIQSKAGTRGRSLLCGGQLEVLSTSFRSRLASSPRSTSAVSCSDLSLLFRCLQPLPDRWRQGYDLARYVLGSCCPEFRADGPVIFDIQYNM